MKTSDIESCHTLFCRICQNNSSAFYHCPHFTCPNPTTFQVTTSWHGSNAVGQAKCRIWVKLLLGLEFHASVEYGWSYSWTWNSFWNLWNQEIYEVAQTFSLWRIWADVQLSCFRVTIFIQLIGSWDFLLLHFCFHQNLTDPLASDHLSWCHMRKYIPHPNVTNANPKGWQLPGTAHCRALGSQRKALGTYAVVCASENGCKASGIFGAWNQTMKWHSITNLLVFPSILQHFWEMAPSRQSPAIIITLGSLCTDCQHHQKLTSK